MSWWPFRKSGPGDDLSPDIERIFEKVSRFLDDETAQNNALPENLRVGLMQNQPCDQIANGFGEFGRALTNPIPVNGPVGELLYLSRLEAANAVPIAFHRLGAHGDVDIFEVLSAEGQHWDLLCLSLYYPRKSRAIPAGYRVTDRSRSSLIKGTTLLVDGFPRGIYRAAVECTTRMFGMSIADPRLKSLEEREAIRPERHLAALRQLKFSSQTSAPRSDNAATRASDDRDGLLTLFDETLRLWKLHIEKSGRDLGVRHSEKFERELSYLALYLMTTLLFAGAPRQDPAPLADRLARSILTRLAHREGVQVGDLVKEYRERFDRFRKVGLFTTSDRVLMDEGALMLGQQLTGANSMLFGTLVTSIVAATLEPLQDGLASLQR